MEVDREAFGLGVGDGDGTGGLVLREREGDGHVFIRINALRFEGIFGILAYHALRQTEIDFCELLLMDFIVMMEKSISDNLSEYCDIVELQ